MISWLCMCGIQFLLFWDSFSSNPNAFIQRVSWKLKYCSLRFAISQQFVPFSHTPCRRSSSSVPFNFGLQSLVFIVFLWCLTAAWFFFYETVLCCLISYKICSFSCSSLEANSRADELLQSTISLRYFVVSRKQRRDCGGAHLYIEYAVHCRVFAQCMLPHLFPLVLLPVSLPCSYRIIFLLFHFFVTNKLREKETFSEHNNIIKWISGLSH